MVKCCSIDDWWLLAHAHLHQQIAEGNGALFTLGTEELYEHEAGGTADWKKFPHRLMVDKHQCLWAGVTSTRQGSPMWPPTGRWQVSGTSAGRP